MISLRRSISLRSSFFSIGFRQRAGSAFFVFVTRCSKRIWARDVIRAHVNSAPSGILIFARFFGGISLLLFPLLSLLLAEGSLRVEFYVSCIGEKGSQKQRAAQKGRD